MSKPVKTAVITASYSGLGYELCKILLQNKYRLLCLDRNLQASQKAHQNLRQEFPESDIECINVDLSSIEAIQHAAEKVLSKTDVIDFLFNVAGVATATQQHTDTGVELHFQVNTIAPIALLTKLKPALQMSEQATVVVVGSSAMKLVRKFDLDKLLKPTSFKKMSGAYAHSKLAIAMAMEQISKEYAPICLRVVDPGLNRTPMSASKAMPLLIRLIQRWFPSPDNGAKKIYLAATEDFGGRTGIYIEKNSIAELPKAAQVKEDRQALVDLIRRLLDGGA